MCDLRFWIVSLIVLLPARPAKSEILVQVARSIISEDFVFDGIPLPAVNDAGATAKWRLIDGRRDRNGRDVDALHDGQVPTDPDQPGANFFFSAGTGGGRLLVDLEKTISLQRISSYSWHPTSRAPQVYRVYGGKETLRDLNLAPTRDIDPASCGWQLIAKVDTRDPKVAPGGQHAASITGTNSIIGEYRYLLFVIDSAASTDAFGNTFFSEIDIVDLKGPPCEFIKTDQPDKLLLRFQTEDHRYKFIVDSTIAPDLKKWVTEKLAPVIIDWYPQIVKHLPSPDYTAPSEIVLKFRDDMGTTPAWANGNRVFLNARWFRAEQEREAGGAVVHELVHVVQQYPGAKSPPGWVTEGVADYVRWYLYEPQVNGAEITPRNFEKAQFDASYRISANFLNWVTLKYDKEVVRKLNAAARSGEYEEQLWKDWTGKSLADLNAEWKSEHKQRLTLPPK